MGERAKILRSSFILAVPNLARSTAHWRDVLGFEHYEVDSPGWSFLGRDGIGVRLGECPDAIPPADLGDHNYFGYIVFDRLDAYHDEIRPKGAEIIALPQDRPWGMREMAVRTIDGHRIVFAQKLG